MEQVKIFSTGSDYNILENQINDWIIANNFEIVRVLQSSSGENYKRTIITIFYKEKNKNT